MKGFRTIEESYRTTFMIVLAAMAIAAMLMLTGCTTTKYVPMPEIHENHHWHTDTVKQTDSIINNQTTVIREVDSATMAQYGIRLEKAQRAWLIQNDRLQREIERLQAISTDRDTVRDSIPQPYPVTEYVERKRSRLDWFLTITGIIALMAVIVFVAVKVRKFLPFS